MKSVDVYVNGKLFKVRELKTQWKITRRVKDEIEWVVNLYVDKEILPDMDAVKKRIAESKELNAI